MRNVIFCVLVVLLWVSTIALGVGGVMPGSGTEGDPYLIEDLADFDVFADEANAGTYWAEGVYTKLMCDIDLSGRTYDRAVIASDTDDTNNLFQGITYKGSFDGNNCLINNLKVSGAEYCGLFGLNQGIVKDLGVTNTRIMYNIHFAGAIAGWNAGDISNCFSTGEITGTGGVIGGLAGNNYGTIVCSYSTCSINSLTEDTDTFSVGGLVGQNGHGEILESYSSGIVCGTGFVGGLVGNNGINGLVENCYSDCYVNCFGSYAGGLVGSNGSALIRKSYSAGIICGAGEGIGGLSGTNYEGTIENCYSIASVNGGGSVGGLVGGNSKGTVTNCYATGTVISTNEQFGGLVGYNGYHLYLDSIGLIENGYYFRYSGESNEYGICLNSTQVQDKSSFAGFDFEDDGSDGTDDIWAIEDGYMPRLSWQKDQGFRPPHTVVLTSLIGSGTESDPYIIANFDDLMEFRSNSSLRTGYFSLVDDIDLNNLSFSHSFIPEVFYGRFFGNGHKINNFTIEGQSNLGFFSGLYGSVYELVLDDASISGNGDNVGGFTGCKISGSIVNCSFSGSVNSLGASVGGLAGEQRSGYIYNCISIGTVSALDNAGGLVGNNESYIQTSYSVSSVDCTGVNSGGLVGNSKESDITNCYYYIYCGAYLDFGTSLDDEELENKDSFYGFSFLEDGGSGDWTISDGYMPRLFYQSSPGFKAPRVLDDINTTLTGKGEAQDPFIISDYNDLMEFRNNTALRIGHYRLESDIDLSGNVYTNSIVTENFYGHFNGNGKTIDNLVIEGVSNLGLFSSLFGSVKMLALENVSIISSGNNVGGLAGNNYGDISSCYCTGSVSGEGDQIGCLVGSNISGTISNSYSVGTVIGGDYAGGFCGNNNSIISNCYAIGEVQGVGAVGGFCGANVNGEINSCFWNSDVSGLDNSYGGEGLPTSEMKKQSTYTDSGWDFVSESINGGDDIWIMGDYPKLYNLINESNIVYLPDLRGMTESEASAALASSGLVLSVISYEHNAIYPTGKVAYQNIPEGLVSLSAYDVSVVVSLGPLLDGNGIKENPYRINNFSDFEAFCSESDYWADGVYVKLMADIDLDPALPGREVYSQAPIAGGPFEVNGGLLLYGIPYLGHFDGNGHVIRNLTLTTGQICGGLFGYADSGSSISNLGVEDVSIICRNTYAGGLAAVSHAVVTNCYTTGTVSGLSVTGGLIGEHGLLDRYNYDNTLNNPGKVINSYSICSVSGDSFTGGLVGVNRIPVIRSYSTGDVSGEQVVGGLVGCNTDGFIENCYSLSNVSSTGSDPSGFGGLVGLTSGIHIGEYVNFYIHGKVANSFSAGRISADGAEKVGGLIGDDYTGLIENCFWDVDVSGQVTSDGGYGVSTSLMKEISTFKTMGWDFSFTDGDLAVWHMPEDSYPILSGRKPDLNDDLIVSMEDFAIFSGNWLNTGFEPTNSYESDYDFSGMVDIADLEIFVSYWLEQFEVSLPLNLVSYFKLDELDGDVAVDSSSCGIDGVVAGEPVRGAGQNGGSYVFDGAVDYVQVEGFNGIGGSAARTVAAWIKADEDLANSENKIHAIVSWGKAEAGKKWAFILDAASGQLALATYGGKVIGGADLEDGLWHHVAVVLPAGADNLNQVKMYVDGAEIGTNAASLDAEINTAMTEDVLIGAMDTDAAGGVQSPAFLFKGAMDEVRIYNTDLLAGEIAELKDEE